MRKNQVLLFLDTVPVPLVSTPKHGQEVWRRLDNTDQGILPEMILWVEDTYSLLFRFGTGAFGKGIIVTSLLLSIGIMSNDVKKPLLNSNVQAYDLVREMQIKAWSMSDGEKARVDGQIVDDMESLIAQALRAKDLEMVSNQEFIEEVNSEGLTSSTPKAALVTTFPQIASLPVLSSSTNNKKLMAPVSNLIRYTDEGGNKVVLGVDHQDRVVLKLVQPVGERWLPDGSRINEF